MHKTQSLEVSPFIYMRELHMCDGDRGKTSHNEAVSSRTSSTASKRLPNLPIWKDSDNDISTSSVMASRLKYAENTDKMRENWRIQIADLQNISQGK
jgi:hypothetical protein